jgi:hypothetical protein
MRIYCRQLLFDHNLKGVIDHCSHMLTDKTSFLSIPFGPDEKSKKIFVGGNDKIIDFHRAPNR